MRSYAAEDDDEEEGVGVLDEVMLCMLCFFVYIPNARAEAARQGALAHARKEAWTVGLKKLDMVKFNKKASIFFLKLDFYMKKSNNLVVYRRGLTID